MVKSLILEVVAGYALKETGYTLGNRQLNMLLAVTLEEISGGGNYLFLEILQWYLFISRLLKSLSPTSLIFLKLQSA